jgi:hypothetical protein
MKVIIAEQRHCLAERLGICRTYPYTYLYSMKRYKAMVVILRRRWMLSDILVAVALVLALLTFTCLVVEAGTGYEVEVTVDDTT